MSVRRRNKKLRAEQRLFDTDGPLTSNFVLPPDPAVMDAERERLKKVLQEQKKIDYVLGLKRFGFKMGKAHKA